MVGCCGEIDAVLFCSHGAARRSIKGVDILPESMEDWWEASHIPSPVTKTSIGRTFVMDLPPYCVIPSQLSDRVAKGWVLPAVSNYST